MEGSTLAADIGQRLLAKEWRLVLAESCTGGGLAHAITEIPGSSNWFERGFVTYTNVAKEEMLGVSKHTLESHGAVSQATVTEMSEGALRHSHGHVSIAVSGIAGPAGGTPDKPVGLVWFAWMTPHLKVPLTKRYVFSGDRTAVREGAVVFALEGLQTLL